MSTDTPVALWGIRRTARELVDGTIRVQIDIDPKNRKAFNELLGEIDMPVALAPIKSEAISESESGVRGPAQRTLAQLMHVNGYFRNPKLWRALHNSGVYTLQTHKQWVQEQDCIVRGTLNLPCHGDVVLHHCTSASIPAAGAELQPENPNKVPHWYGVPLCHNHHRNWVHNDAGREEKSQLFTQAVALMAGRAKAAMKKHMGLDTLADLTEGELRDFEMDIGFEHAAAA